LLSSLQRLDYTEQVKPVVARSGRVRIAAIICTRNRKNDLERCLSSLNCQRTSIDELVIVDSSDEAKRLKTTHEAGVSDGISPVYIISTPGLPLQRNKGVAALISNPEIICFFDDDVELDSGYIERIVIAFASDASKEIIGMCGNALNERRRSIFDRILRRFFMITDNTNGIVLPSGDVGHVFEPMHDMTVAVLSGCNMCFRSSIFFRNGLRFDENLNDYAFLEDQDFSMRASREGTLLQLVDAKLIHHQSTISRPDKSRLFETYIVNSFYLLRKNSSPTLLNYCCYGWRLVGKMVQAMVLSVSCRSLSPLIGWSLGVLHMNSLARRLGEQN
jgi:GT2 family glycosyltransferase